MVKKLIYVYIRNIQVQDGYVLLYRPVIMCIQANLFI